MRPRLHSAGAGALAMLWLAMLSPAQVRRSVIGVVTGPDDKPLGGASVTLVGSPGAGWLRLCSADVVRATADVAGRFRAELLPTLAYSAWATGPVAADGGHAASPVVEGICVGRFAELRARTAVAARSLRIAGWQTWQQDKVAAQLVPIAQTPLAMPLAVDADGKAALPPLPTGGVVVAVLDGTGALMWEAMLADQDELQLPPPQTLGARVLEGGKPVAGVPILQQVSQGTLGVPTAMLGGFRQRDDWRQVGVTDQDGRATLRLPLDADPWQAPPSRLLFAARLPGKAEALSGWNNRSPLVDGVVVDKHDGDELRFHLQQGQVLRGRVLPLPGQVVAGASLLLAGRTRLQIRPNSFTVGTRAFRTVVQADGGYVFDSLPPMFDGLGLTFAVPAEQPGAAPVPVPWSGVTLDQPFDLDLARTVPVTLRIVGVDGAPATGCTATLLPMERGNLSTSLPACQLQLDGSGEARLRLPAGGWFLFACDGSSYRASVLELADRPVAERFSLQSLAAVRGTILTADGKPAAGAALRIRGTRAVGANLDQEQRLLQRLQSSLNSRLIASTEADANGRFTCWFLELPGVSYEVSAWWQGRMSQPATLATDSGEVEFRLQ